MTDTVTKSVEAHRKRVTGGIFRNSSAMGILDGRQRQLMKMKVTTVLDVGSSCSSSTNDVSTACSRCLDDQLNVQRSSRQRQCHFTYAPTVHQRYLPLFFLLYCNKDTITKCFDVATAMLRGVLVAVNTITSSVRIHARQILVLPLLFEPGH